VTRGTAQEDTSETQEEAPDVNSPRGRVSNWQNLQDLPSPSKNADHSTVIPVRDRETVMENDAPNVDVDVNLGTVVIHLHLHENPLVVKYFASIVSALTILLTILGMCRVIVVANIAVFYPLSLIVILLCLLIFVVEFPHGIRKYDNLFYAHFGFMSHALGRATLCASLGILEITLCHWSSIIAGVALLLCAVAQYYDPILALFTKKEEELSYPQAGNVLSAP